MIATTNKKKTVKSKKVNKTQTKQQKEEEDILQAIDAISDEESDEDAGQVIDDDGQDWDEETTALRKMISDGKFNDLLKRHNQERGVDYEEDAEEDELESEDAGVEDVEAEEEEDEDEEEHNENEPKDSDSESSDDEEQQKHDTRRTALAAAIQSSNRNLPFAESFTVVPPTPLPFSPSGGPAKSIAVGVDEEDTMVDIHDDLKREVAFYDTALEAVHLARGECERAGIPFTRPDDFFAEMIKTDEHMAKIKDRLIFETKKIEAVQRRKSNKEQTVMAKERRAHRLSEKAKQKKDHMKDVQEWKRDAERGRGKLGGRVVDVEEEEERLRGVGKKRAAADRRYGFGGKRGRFKQNDAKTLNDMSGFKARGSFKGGQKTSPAAGGGKKKRAGKRARDARSGRS